MTLDIATVVRATGAQVLRVFPDGDVRQGQLSVADLQRAFHGIRIDSRSVQSQDLFVALPGERVDGHQFVGQAFAQGALASIVSQVPERGSLKRSMRDAGSFAPADECFLLVTADCLSALQHLATYWRRAHAASVIGVTGSLGKTTTKEIVAGVLASRESVLKSEANLNTEIGLPLTLLRLNRDHRVAVLEMGMYVRGDIALLARIAEPEIGIVTAVAPIHLERMGTIERIAREKSELIAALPPSGLAILNGDDPWTRAMAETSGIAPAITVGLHEKCTYRATDITPNGLHGLSFSIRAEGQVIPVETSIPGTHTVSALLTASAIARRRGLTWDDIREALAAVRLDLRQRIIRGSPSVLIIDDSYNAAPPSMHAALDLLNAAPGAKIAVLGDMLELGPQEKEAHFQVGERAAQVADRLVVRGTRGAWIAEAAAESGLDPERVVRAESNAEAVQLVRAIVGATEYSEVKGSDRTMPGSPRESARASETAVNRAAEWTVLVKGSRGMKMEEVVQGLGGEA